ASVSGGESQFLKVVVQPDGRILVGQEQSLTRLTAGGGLDTSFAPIDSLQFFFKDVVLQSNGKIVVPGKLFDASWAVRRFNSDGSADMSFGTGGLVSHTFGFPTGAQEAGFAGSVAIQPDGKIVAVGDSSPGAGAG